MTPKKLVKITSIIQFQSIIWLFYIQIAMNYFDLFLSSAPMPKLACKNTQPCIPQPKHPTRYL